MPCENLRELLEAERLGLSSALGHRRYLISRKEGKNPKDIDWDRAKQDFLDHFFNAWAEGFKYAYCNYVCKKRDSCDVKDDELNKYIRYSEEG